MELAEIISAMTHSALAGEFEGLFAAVMLLVALLCLGSVIHQLGVRRWPSVQGESISATTRVLGTTSLNRHKTQYHANVEYRYRVDGREYTGSRLSPWIIVASTNLLPVLQKQLAALDPQGRRIEVFHHPNRPDKSYLLRPGWIGIGLSLAVAALLLWVPVTLFGQGV